MSHKMPLCGGVQGVWQPSRVRGDRSTRGRRGKNGRESSKREAGGRKEKKNIAMLTIT